MLFAGCDRGLENAALRPRAAFSRPRSQFFTIRTDLTQHEKTALLRDSLRSCNTTSCRAGLLKVDVVERQLNHNMTFQVPVEINLHSLA